VKYIDKKTVVSVAVGVALFGAVVYGLRMSGVGAATKAADIATTR
jgi:hypothetical protein